MIRSAFQKASGILKSQISATAIGSPVSTLAFVLGRGLKYENTSLGRWLGRRCFNGGSNIGSCRLLHTGDPTTSNLIRESSPRCTSRLSNLSREELFKLKSSIERGIHEDLPPPAIKFASSEGEVLYSESSLEGNLKGILRLLCAYQALSEPKFYGLASISTVLNALDVNPGGKWQHPWRWFSEYLLDCCDPFEKIEVEGITFAKLAFLTHCNGAEVEVFQTNKCTIEAFRQYVMKCASSDEFHMIVHYDRAHLNQTGGSHISPIGGYHAGRDLVLIMDVACFKYPPHWVPLKLLWKAMETIDGVTGKHKWFMVLSQLAYDPSVLYTLNCRGESWISTVYYLTQLPILLKLEHIKDTQDVLSVVFKSDTPNFKELIKRTAEVNRPQSEITHLSGSEKGKLVVQKELLQQVQETNLFKHVNKWLCAAHCENIASLSGKFASPDIVKQYSCQGDIEPGKVVQYTNGSSGGSRFGKGIQKHLPCVDILTMMLFALPSSTWSGVKEKQLLTELSNLLTVDNVPLLLKNEVLSLRQQVRLLIDLGLPMSSSD